MSDYQATLKFHMQNMSNNMQKNMSKNAKCLEGLYQSYQSYWSYICTRHWHFADDSDGDNHIMIDHNLKPARLTRSR